MLKKILIITGIFIVGIASLSLLNKPFQFDTVVADNEGKNPLFTREEELNMSTLNTVTEKIHEKYEELEFGVSSNLKNELRVQVKDDEDYFNLVKKDIESIAKSEIKSSTLKDYTVVVERMDLSLISEKVKNEHKELSHLMSTLLEGLKVYDVTRELNAEYQKSITIHTSIKGSDKDAHKLAMEIEGTVNEILHSKELNSVSNLNSYEIQILNAKGKVVN